MTLSTPWQIMTNDISEGARSVGSCWFTYNSSVCLETWVISLSETPCPGWSSRKTAIKGLTMQSSLPHLPNFAWKATAHTQIIQSSMGFIYFLFISAFEDTPPSISPQLPLKHNRCLPTRLPSTSCLVTAGPLLSTTECLTNSVSELNLEAPLIYPPSLDWQKLAARRESFSSSSALDSHPEQHLPLPEIKSCQLILTALPH